MKKKEMNNVLFFICYDIIHKKRKAFSMKKTYNNSKSKDNVKQEIIKLEKKNNNKIKFMTTSGFMLPILCSGPTILFKYVKEGVISDILQTVEYVGFMSLYVGSISYFVSKNLLKDNNKINELEKILSDINEEEKLLDYDIVTYKDMDYINENRRCEEYTVLFKKKKKNNF